jgi:hypothetical protein
MLDRSFLITGATGALGGPRRGRWLIVARA